MWLNLQGKVKYGAFLQNCSHIRFIKLGSTPSSILLIVKLHELLHEQLTPLQKQHAEKEA